MDRCEFVLGVSEKGRPMSRDDGRERARERGFRQTCAQNTIYKYPRRVHNVIVVKRRKAARPFRRIIPPSSIRAFRLVVEIMKTSATHLGASLLGLFGLLTIAVAAPAPMPTPPGIPTAASAKTQLAALTVATQVDDGEYDRDLFPTWIDQGNSCNTR